jgi:hypothetical protein
LDTCTLISLVKTNLTEDFWALIQQSHHDLVIDSDVFTEAVEQGRLFNHPDAEDVNGFLIDKQIPILSTDITSELPKYRDPGETSCAILSSESGVVLTGDIKARKRFQKYHIPCLGLDEYFFNQLRLNYLSVENFRKILMSLESINAISPERKLFYFRNMEGNLL